MRRTDPRTGAFLPREPEFGRVSSSERPGFRPLYAPPGSTYDGFEEGLTLADVIRVRKSLNTAYDVGDEGTIRAYTEAMPKLVRAVVEERVGIRPPWSPPVEPEAPAEAPSAPLGGPDAREGQEGEGWWDASLGAPGAREKPAAKAGFSADVLDALADLAALVDG